MVIDFKTGEPLPPSENTAILEIIENPDGPRVLIDGIVPRELAHELQSIVKAFNVRNSRLH